jgi:hypothetical protein
MLRGAGIPESTVPPARRGWPKGQEAECVWGGGATALLRKSTKVSSEKKSCPHLNYFLPVLGVKMNSKASKHRMSLGKGFLQPFCGSLPIGPQQFGM